MTWPVRLQEDIAGGGSLGPARLVRLWLPGSAQETLHAIGLDLRHPDLWILTPPILAVRRNGVWGAPVGELIDVDGIRTDFGEHALAGLTARIGTSYPFEALRWYGDKLGIDLTGLRGEIERTDFSELEVIHDRIRSFELQLAEKNRFIDALEATIENLTAKPSQGEAR